MGAKNTVSVLICGQEYTLSGDMPREYIMKLADKVDAKMKELSAGKNQTLSRTAVLAAMLITDEYYRAREDAELLLEENDKLESQASNYEKLWEEAKESFTAFKAEQDNLIEQLRAKVAEQEEYIEASKTIPSEAQKRIDELENRCRDIESSFFDLQMENIRLKNEVEKYKRAEY